MKKTIKIILCITLVVFMCFGMCSCNALDEAKKNIGHYSDDYTEITLGDKVYKACPKELVEAFRGYISENYDLYDYHTQTFIVDKEIPVLLNFMFGDSAMIFDNNIIQIETSIESEELDAPKAQVFKNFGEEYTESILSKERTYYFISAFYFTEEVYEQMIDYATNYKETCYGEYSEDKNEIYLNGTTYIKAPESLHKKYDDYNNSIFDVIDNYDDYRAIYVDSSNELSINTIYEICKDGEILYSYTWDWDTDNTETIDDTYYSYYDEEEKEYYYYVYYFREDVYDKLVDKLMNE